METNAALNTNSTNMWLLFKTNLQYDDFKILFILLNERKPF